MLEILLVMLVVALLGQLSISSWRQHQQMLHLYEVSEQLLNFLNRVQTEAGWHNQNYLIQIERPTPDRWQVVIQRGPSPTTCAASRQHCYRPHWPDITLADETAAQGMTFYGSRGGAYAGHFTLNSPAGTVRIILSAKGRLRRCSYNSYSYNSYQSDRYQKNLVGIPAC